MDLKEVLQEYVATANNPAYNGDYNVINSKFPELTDYDPEVLQEYVATANNPAYGGDYNTINSKFPEFNIQAQQPTQQPTQQPAQQSTPEETESQFSEDELARWSKEMEYEGLWETSKFKKENYRKSDTAEGVWIYTDPATQRSIEVDSENQAHGELVQALEGTLQLEQEDVDARRMAIDKRKEEEEKERTSYIDQEFWKQYPNDRDFYVSYQGELADEIKAEFEREDERRGDMTSTFDVSLDNKEAIVNSGNDDDVARMYLESGRYPGLQAEATGFMGIGNAVEFTLPDGTEVYLDILDMGSDTTEGVAQLQKIDDWYDKNGTKAGLSIFQTVNDYDANGGLNDFTAVQDQLRSMGYDITPSGVGYEFEYGEYTLTKSSTGEVVQVEPGKDNFEGNALGKWLWNNISKEQIQQQVAQNEITASEAIDEYNTRKQEEYAKINDESAISALETNGTISSSIKDGLNGKISKTAQQLLDSVLDKTQREVVNTLTSKEFGTKDIYGDVVYDGKNLSALRNIVDNDFDVKGWRDLSEEDKQAVRDVVQQHSSAVQEGGSRTTQTQALINRYKNTDARQEAELFVQQQMRYEYGDRWASVIAGVDEVTSQDNLEAKTQNHRKRLGMIEISAEKEVARLSGQLNTLMDEAAEAGLGWRTIELPTGKTKIILEGDDKDLVDKYQNLVNSKLGYIEGVSRQYVTSAREANEEFNAFVNEVENAQGLSTAINVNFDTMDILATDVANGFQQLFVGIPAFFGNKAAQERIRMVNAGAQGFETMLTMDQARKYGRAGWFSARTGAQQSANVITAVGMSALGIPPNITTALTSTMFGLSSGGGKRTELNGLVEAGARAEIQLDEINELFDQGKLTALEHREQRIALQKTIAAGKMEAWQMESAIWSSAIVEGGISALIGTVPNAKVVANVLKGGGKSATTQLIKHGPMMQVLKGLGQYGKEIGGELIEELSIYGLSEFNESMIMGRDANYDQFSDTFWSTIVTAGGMNGPTTLYTTTTNAFASKEIRNQVKDILGDLEGLDFDFENIKPGNGDRQFRERVYQNFANKLEQLGVVQSGLEVDALLAGKDMIPQILGQSIELERIKSEIPGNTTVEEHIASLEGKEKQEFASRYKTAQDAVIDLQNQLAQQYESRDAMGEDGIIFQLYGQRGLDIASAISSADPMFDGLSARDKAIRVNQRVKAKLRTDNINRAKQDQGVVNFVEGKLKNYENLDADQRKRLEDQLYEATANELFVTRAVDGVILNAENAVNAEKILGEKLGGKKLSEYVSTKTYETVEELEESIREDEANGRLSASQANDIISGLKDGSVKAAIIGSEHRVIAQFADAAAENIANGDIMQSTAIVHEIGHAVDGLAFTAEEQTEYSQQLENDILSNDKLQRLHLAAMSDMNNVYLVDENSNPIIDNDGNVVEISSMQELAGLVSDGTITADKKQELEEEYVRRVGDYLNDKGSFSQEIKEANKAQQSFQNKLRGLSGGDYKFNQKGDALNYIVSYNNDFKKGRISDATKRRIEARFGTEGLIGGATRESKSQRGINQDASARATQLYNEQGVGAANQILDIMLPAVGRMADRFRTLPGFNKGEIESQILRGKRGAYDLILDYDERSAKYIMADNSAVNVIVTTKGEVKVNNEVVDTLDNPSEADINQYVEDNYGDIGERNQIPIAGYVFQQLNLRLPEFVKAAGVESDFTQDIEDRRDIQADVDIEGDIDRIDRKGTGVKLKERLGPRAMAMHDNVMLGLDLFDVYNEVGIVEGETEDQINNKVGAWIEEQVIEDENGVLQPDQARINDVLLRLQRAQGVSPINTTGKTYKSIGNQVEDDAQRMFGVSPKPGNLTKGDVANSQQYILRNGQTLLNLLPEGFIQIKGEKTASGVQTVLLQSGLYEQVFTSKTRSYYRKKQGLDVKKDFHPIFGITPAGTPNLSDRNTSSRIRALIDQTGRAITVQAAQEGLFTKAKKTTSRKTAADALMQRAVLEDGKSSVLFSKSMRDLMANDLVVGESIINSMKKRGAEAIQLSGGNLQGALGQILDYNKLADLHAQENPFKNDKARERYIASLEKKVTNVGEDLQKIHDDFLLGEAETKAIEDSDLINKTVSDLMVDTLVVELEGAQVKGMEQLSTKLTGKEINTNKDGVKATDVRNSENVARVRKQVPKISERLNEKLNDDAAAGHMLDPGYAAAAKVAEGRDEFRNENNERSVTEYRNVEGYNEFKLWKESELFWSEKEVAKGKAPEGAKAGDAKGKAPKGTKPGDFKLTKAGSKIRQDNRGGITTGIEDTRFLTGSTKGDRGNYNKFQGEGIITKGNLSSTQLKNLVLPKINDIQQSQREYNKGFISFVEVLREMVADGSMSKEDAIIHLNIHTSNPKGLGRMAAILDYLPVDSKGNILGFSGESRLEHMTPAAVINMTALGYVLTGDAKARTEFDNVMDNYRLAYLPAKFDNMVNVDYKFSMPHWWNTSMSPLVRYFSPRMLRRGFGQLRLKQMSTGVVLGGTDIIDTKAFAEAELRQKEVLLLDKDASANDLDNRKNEVTNAVRSALRKSAGESRGMSAWDFDDTLATTTSSVIFNKDGKTKIVSAEDFAKEGAKLKAEGWIPDFSEFNKVMGGKPGPMFEAALKRAQKYGTEDTFILTARPQEAAPAIKEFLDSVGLDIPLENITGLANSTGESKAAWLLNKYANGYTEIAFADDAMQNIDAVKKVFDAFDIKGKVEQAKIRFSKDGANQMSSILDQGGLDLESDLNTILEETKNVGAEKKFSKVRAKQRGKNKGRFKFFLPPSAEDLKGLIYPILGKGKVGEQHHAWFKKNLFDPFTKGIRRINNVSLEVTNGIRDLKKAMPDVKKKLRKNITGTSFTNDQAIRVYNWVKAGFDVPGLSQADQNRLVRTVEGDPTMKAFADSLNEVMSKPTGQLEGPDASWLAGSIASDASDVIKSARDLHLGEFNSNIDSIFSEENLNKIEAVFGSNHREAIEDMMYRMKTGSTRPAGQNRMMNSFMNWINGSVGTTMFFNARSAMLQMISNVNFVNWHDNNPLKAAAAFANQKQYWSDVAMIFNSPFLKQRRGGIGTDLNAAELLRDMQGSDKPMKVFIAKLLQIGFTPTQIADSLAIATGGATMYRNRIQTYIDQGMSKADAETKAFEDMMEIAEETQQSARPDKISQQQASPLGKLILAFQNTPMQYNRIMKRAAQDWVNGRGDPKEHASKIVYYGAVQSAIFYGLQSAIWATMFGDDEEEDDVEKKQDRILNGMVDSILRGAGIGGAVVSTAKNSIIEFLEQKAKEDDDEYFTQFNEADVLIEVLNLSPPIGIKARKLVGGIRTWQYNQEVIDQMDKTDLDNPMWDASTSVTESLTNIPLNRLYSKYQNLSEALNSDNETWQRVAMFLGWSRWNFGIQNQDVMSAKGEVKEIKAQEAEERREQKKIEREVQKNEEELQVIEDNKLDQDEKRDEGADEVECAAVSRSGKRCSNMALPGESFCTIHVEVPQQQDEVQCSHIKDDGKRCKMKTKNKSGKCYYHD